MRLRESAGIGEGRDEIRPCDPRQLFVMDGYNVRDLTTPEARAELDELKAQVKQHGVRAPLVVRFDGETKWIVEGHRRHKVALELIEEYEASDGKEGRNIDFVPIMGERRGTNEIDRDFSLETSNSGTRLKPLERANLIYRLHTQRGLPLEAIATGLGCSLASVKHTLSLRAMPEQVKDQVRDGVIAANEAAKVIKNLPKGVSQEEAAKIIKANQDENKRLGVGKRRNNKVTAKTLKRDKPKAEAKTEPKAAPVAAPIAEDETAAQQPLAEAPIAPVVGTEPTTAVLDEMHQPTRTPPSLEDDFADRMGRPRPKPVVVPQPKSIDDLLLNFISADVVTLAMMHQKLCRERDEAAGSGDPLPAQFHLIDVCEGIGHLRFPEEWEGAKGNTELQQVA